MVDEGGGSVALLVVGFPLVPGSRVLSGSVADELLRGLVCPFDGERCHGRGVCRQDDCEGVPVRVCCRHPVLSTWPGVLVVGSSLMCKESFLDGDGC